MGTGIAAEFLERLGRREELLRQGKPEGDVAILKLEHPTAIQFSDIDLL